LTVPVTVRALCLKSWTAEASSGVRVGSGLARADELAGLGDRVRDFVAASKAPVTLRAYGMEVMPAVLLDALILSYPSERYRSAWIGVAVHSLQSVPIGAVVLGLSF
jgi:hypothetical protein